MTAPDDTAGLVGGPLIRQRSAMDHAQKLVANGTLLIDSEGGIWRASILAGGVVKPITPRRVENVGGKGYLRVSFWVAGELFMVMAHRLVWEQANGPIPRGVEVNHKDLNKQNNRISNLELVTPTGNMLHAYRHGRARCWERKGKNGSEWRPGKLVLSDKQTAEVIRRRATGEKLKSIATDFGITESYVSWLYRSGARRG